MRRLAYSRRAIAGFGAAARPDVWTIESLRLLRELALARLPVAKIAAALGRSESAIRNKAGMHGISLTTAARDGK
jgi:hypothetical protein